MTKQHAEYMISAVLILCTGWALRGLFDVTAEIVHFLKGARNNVNNTHNDLS